MTYRELRALLDEFSDDQLSMTATVYSVDVDEYWALQKLAITDDDNDTLDPDHPYFVF